MEKLIFVLMLSISFNASAEERKELELPDFSKVTESLKERDDKESVKMTCQTTTGVLLKSGDKGFDQCMNENTNARRLPKEMSPNRNNTTEPSVSFSKDLFKSN